MNPYAPKDIRLDHPLFEMLVDRQVEAVARRDYHYQTHIESQLRTFIEDPEEFLAGWKSAEALMEEAAHDY